jgi:hypothetical protein
MNLTRFLTFCRQSIHVLEAHPFKSDVIAFGCRLGLVYIADISGQTIGFSLPAGHIGPAQFSVLYLVLFVIIYLYRYCCVSSFRMCDNNLSNMNRPRSTRGKLTVKGVTNSIQWCYITSTSST